jgi:hypothetical protein
MCSVNFSKNENVFKSLNDQIFIFFFFCYLSQNTRNYFITSLGYLSTRAREWRG